MPSKASGGPREPPNPGSNAATASGPASDGPASRTKVICRRLPPTLPAAVFWTSVEPWTSDADVDWKAYKPGRSTQTGPNSKESVNSVAYIHFKRQDLVTKFAAAYNGHVFRDSKGQISRVSVEYAPFQKTPAKRQKPDALSGTIDDDPDYQAFLASLNAPPEPKAAAETSTAKAPINKSTPLLEALRQQKKLAKEKKLASNSKGKAPELPANALNPAKMTRAERRAYLKHLKKEEMAAAASEIKGKTADGADSGKRKPGLRIKGAQATPTAASGPAVNNEAGKIPQAPKGSTANAKHAPKQVQKPAEAPKPVQKMTILAPPKPASAEPTKPDTPNANTGLVSPPVSSKPKALGNFDDIVGQFAKQMSVGSKPALRTDGKNMKEAAKLDDVASKEVPASATAAGRGRGGPGARGGRGSDVSSRGRGQSRGGGMAIKGALSSHSAPIPTGSDTKSDGNPMQSVPSAPRGRGRGGAPADRGRGAASRGGFRGGRGNSAAPPSLAAQLPT